MRNQQKSGSSSACSRSCLCAGILLAMHPVLGFIVVGALWGCTNPLLNAGDGKFCSANLNALFAGSEGVQQSSVKHNNKFAKFVSETVFLLTNWKVVEERACVASAHISFDRLLPVHASLLNQPSGICALRLYSGGLRCSDCSCLADSLHMRLACRDLNGTARVQFVDRLVHCCDFSGAWRVSTHTE
jgi:hypothetical protein